MSNPRVLAFAGSTRKDSFNRRLIQIAAAGAVQAGAQVTTIDLADYPLPIFNEDLEREQGPPAHATKLKELFGDHDGLLIASPEYNSSISPLLKNTIDWVSRAAEGEEPLAAYKNKVASLLSASPGGLGGLRGLVHLRSILGNIGVTVLPDQLAIGSAFNAFSESGELLDPKQQSRAQAIGASLAGVLHKLAS